MRKIFIAFFVFVAALIFSASVEAHHKCGHTGPSADPCAVEPEPDPAPEEPTSGEPATGTVIARADYEDQTVGDMTKIQCYPGDLTFPWGSAAQGSYFGRYTVREGFNDPETGHERCESARLEIPTLETYYTRAWVRVPSTSEFQEWLTVIQWKTTVEACGCPPPLDLFLLPPKYRGDEYLSLRSGDSSTIAWDSPTIQRDKWYRIITKTYMNPDPSKGYAEVWFGDVNGVSKQTMRNGSDRFYMKTAAPDETHHFRFGIRRSTVNTGTTIMEFDDLSIEQIP